MCSHVSASMGSLLLEATSHVWVLSLSWPPPSRGWSWSVPLNSHTKNYHMYLTALDGDTDLSGLRK